MLSKSRGFRPPGAQARPKAQPLPASPTDSDSAYYAGYNSSEEYEKEGGAYFDKEVGHLSFRSNSVALPAGHDISVVTWAPPAWAQLLNYMYW